MRVESSRFWQTICLQIKYFIQKHIFINELHYIRERDRERESSECQPLRLRETRQGRKREAIWTMWESGEGADVGAAPHKTLQYKNEDTKEKSGGKRKKRYKRQLAKVTDCAKKDNPKLKKPHACWGRASVRTVRAAASLRACALYICLFVFQGPQRVTESEGEADRRDERKGGTTGWVLMTQFGTFR